MSLIGMQAGIMASGAVIIGSHRYWGYTFTATASASFVQMGEVRMKTVAAGTNVATGGTAGASSFYGAGYEPAKAFDANTTTLWDSATGLPQSLWYDFGAGVTQSIVEYDLYPVTGDPTEIPTAWTFWYSDDNITRTTVHTKSSQSLTAGSYNTYSAP